MIEYHILFFFFLWSRAFLLFAFIWIEVIMVEYHILLFCGVQLFCCCLLSFGYILFIVAELRSTAKSYQSNLEEVALLGAVSPQGHDC